MKNKMLNIIENKYKELKLDQKDTTQIFWKIVEFEGNAMGQIGEEFMKGVFKDLGISVDNDKDVIHDEYDILSNGVKFEIKTASLGKNGTFQFNGINPKYNYNFLIFLGISKESLFFNVASKKDIAYDHSDRSLYWNNGILRKKLVKMNPDNDVNRKITISKKQMISFDLFEESIEEIFGKETIDRIIEFGTPR